MVGLMLLLANCTYNDTWSGTVPSSSIEYMIFGHTSGFCLNCDEVYKIIDGKLFGASGQMISDPDAVPLTQLPSSAYNLVSPLVTQVPKRIVTGSITTTNTIGTYFPDAGHYYIEVSQNKKVYRWYIEPGNLPNDLQPFINAVQDALGKLN
jgi:hypothetical protein